jgi:hypothetical protein
MRYARYLRIEKYIAASDTGGVIERWRYGRRLLEDGTATTPAGNMKHGETAKLIAKAAARGYKIGEQEIQRRLRAARTYETEAQIRELLTDFATWDEVARAGFPAVEALADAEPYDPRDADERARDTARSLLRRAEGDDAQPALFDYFPDDRFDETSTLAELAKYADEMAELTERFRQRDEERAEYLRKLIDAVGGDLGATWEDAQSRLDAAEVAS